MEIAFGEPSELRSDRSSRGVQAANHGYCLRNDRPSSRMMIMNPDQIEVNGLKVPLGLISAIQRRRWSSLGSSSSLATVFGSGPVRPKFFSLEEIRAINNDWKDETDPAYLGYADASLFPGNIDPRESLIIAELGPDQLIALDYRRSDVPDVLFATDDVWSPWRLVAGSVEELLSKLAASA